MKKVIQPLTALHFNCSNPFEVLKALKINSDPLFTGVFMDEFFDIGSCGPFKITFKQAAWFKQFIRVMYWRAPAKLKSKKILQGKQTKRYFTNQDCIRLEDGEPMELWKKEYRKLLLSKGGNDSQLANICKIHYSLDYGTDWYSPKPVIFKMADIDNVMFMTNVQDHLDPFVTHEIRGKLLDLLGTLYIEDNINDPQINERTY